MRILTILLVVAALAGPVAAADEPTLWTRLERFPGGAALHVRAVIDHLYWRLERDPRTAIYFDGIDMVRLKQQSYLFIAKAIGAPVEYKGPDVRTAHQRFRITQEAWDLTVKAVIESLDDFHVPDPERSMLLKVIGSLKDDVVYKP